MKSKTIDAPSQMLQVARRSRFARECGELIGKDTHGPGFAQVAWMTQDFRRSLIFMARAKWTIFDEPRHRYCRAVCRQFFWPLGPLSGDDDPFLGKEVLAQLWHGEPLACSIGRIHKDCRY